MYGCPKRQVGNCLLLKLVITAFALFNRISIDDNAGPTEYYRLVQGKKRHRDILNTFHICLLLRHVILTVVNAICGRLLVLCLGEFVDMLF